MTRRGRPSGSDSAETRQRIINAARAEFANRGYDGAAITAIAEKADLSPGSIYHHYSGKPALYEAVFDATARTIWADLGTRAADYRTVVEIIDAMIDDARQLGDKRSQYSDFLANVPLEARQHPEFAHLLVHRSKYQDEAFSAVAELGLATGELAGFDLKHATELIRAPLMGWFFERHFRGAEVDHGGEAIKTLFRILADRPGVESGQQQNGAGRGDELYQS